MPMVERPVTVRVGVIGLEHPHAYGLALTLASAGASIDAVAADQAQTEQFRELFPGADARSDAAAVVADDEIDLVLVVTVPDERSAVAALAMHAGKDVVIDKPAVTTLDQLEDLRRVQHDTARICTVWFGERFDSRATIRALDLIGAGAIGTVVHVIGLGPHQLAGDRRPGWFFDPARQGGILADLATHQIDQFLVVAGGDRDPTVAVDIIHSEVANIAHPDRPGLEDFGQIHLRAGSVSGSLRVDWFSPDGLGTWGDGRLLVLGTTGYVEVRRNIDVGGAAGGDHLLLVDGERVHRFDCGSDALRSGSLLLADVRDRTNRLVDQAHVFRVCELALRAQAGAHRGGHLTDHRGVG